ncbi:MAG TPA: hypothetical protein VFO55_01450 [Gemmatimonadaceae bacterium]|nr:hypothetical protein [Gemmatimonadaceae bacterium]
MSRLALLASLVFLGACATTGSTFRSGVGDRQLEHPPYYAGKGSAAPQSAAAIARFPVSFQRGASQAGIFDPASGDGSSIAAFVRDMNTFLDSTVGGATLPAVSGQAFVAPNVYFGCAQDASNDCVERGDSVLGRRGTTMRLAVERPSREWIARTGALLDSTKTSHVLVITLEVGQYWPRQTGFRGDKSVELGTGYTASLPWLTSLETPVTVLQLTGALLDRDGIAVRIGAEGILAVRTPIVASGLGAQRLLSDEDVERARTLRNAGKGGPPLVWQSAICALITQLGAGSCTGSV